MAANDVEKNLDGVIKEPSCAMDSSHYLREQTLHLQTDAHFKEPLEQSFENLEKDRLAIEREAKIKAFFEMIAGEHSAGNFSMF